MLKIFFRIFFDIIFPPQCVSCNVKIDNKNFLCNRCISKIDIKNGLSCSICGRRLPNTIATCHKNGFPILSVTNYKNDISREIIYALKYKNIISLANLIASLIKTCIEKIFIKSDLKNFIAIPIPISKKRKRARGYNQSELIAKKFIEKINYKIPLVTNNLIRIKDTKSQTKCKNYKERKINIHKSFFVLYPEKIKNTNILLFDDVFTSGATMNEAIKTLKNNGVKKIIGIVFIKT